MSARSRSESKQTLSPEALPKTPKVPTIDIVVNSPLWNAHRGIKALLRGTIAEAASPPFLAAAHAASDRRHRRHGWGDWFRRAVRSEGRRHGR